MMGTQNIKDVNHFLDEKDFLHPAAHCSTDIQHSLLASVSSLSCGNGTGQHHFAVNRTKEDIGRDEVSNVA